MHTDELSNAETHFLHNIYAWYCIIQEWQLRVGP